MGLNNIDHVLRSDTTTEQDARCTKATSGEDDTTLGGEGNHTVGTKCEVVGLNASYLGTITGDLLDKYIIPVSQVGALDGRSEICSDGASALTANELFRQL